MNSSQPQSYIDIILPEAHGDASNIPDNLEELYEARLNSVLANVMLIDPKHPPTEEGEFEQLVKPNVDLQWLREKLGFSAESGIDNLKLLFFAIDVTRNSAGNSTDLPKRYHYTEWQPYFAEHCSKEKLKEALNMDQETPDEDVIEYVRTHLTAEQCFFSLVGSGKKLRTELRSELAQILDEKKRREGATHATRKSIAELLRALPHDVTYIKNLDKLLGPKTAGRLRKEMAELWFEKLDAEFVKRCAEEDERVASVPDSRLKEVKGYISQLFNADQREEALSLLQSCTTQEKKAVRISILLDKEATPEHREIMAAVPFNFFWSRCTARDSIPFYSEDKFGSGVANALLTVLGGVDEDPSLRMAAAQGLGEYNGKKVTSGLLRTLSEGDPEISLAVISSFDRSSMSRIDDESLEVLTSSLLNDENVKVREAIASLLAKRFERIVHNAFFEEIGESGVGHFESLRTRLMEDTATFNSLALGRFSAITVGMNALGNMKKVERAEFVSAVYDKSGGNNLKDALLKALSNDENPQVRKCIVEKLHAHPEASIIEALINTLNDEDADVSLAAASAPYLSYRSARN